jgi:hypothetical protein
MYRDARPEHRAQIAAELSDAMREICRDGVRMSLNERLRDIRCPRTTSSNGPHRRGTSCVIPERLVDAEGWSMIRHFWV